MRSHAWKFRSLFGALVIFTIHGWGCTSPAGNKTGYSDSPQLAGQAQNCDTPKAGCSCGEPGQIAECGREACKDGIRKCMQVGQEFSTWGPCRSASTGESC